MPIYTLPTAPTATSIPAMFSSIKLRLAVPVSTMSCPQKPGAAQDFEIAPKQIRFGSHNLSGYELSAFDDAFERYLSPAPPSTTPTSPTSLKSEQKPQHQGPTAGSAVGLSSAEDAYENNDVEGVGIESATPEGNGKDRDEDEDVGDRDTPWELTM